MICGTTSFGPRRELLEAKDDSCSITNGPLIWSDPDRCRDTGGLTIGSDGLRYSLARRFVVGCGVNHGVSD